MKLARREAAFIFIFLLTLLMGTAGVAMANFAGGVPKPGEVYKEFYFNHSNSNWRVTDPNMDLKRFPEGAAFLPNPILQIHNVDLAGARKAEVILDFWVGHVGTIDKKFRVNGNSWIAIPELTSIGSPNRNYMHQTNHRIDIPLGHLRSGTNSFEGTSGGNPWSRRSDGSLWGWGQWGWYGIVLRVYYDSSKTNVRGVISSPSSNSLFSDNPTVSANITSGTADRVDFLAYYDGFDTDGDGVYKDWHRNYHRSSWSDPMGIKGHVGTATSPPFRVTWDTSWVPDQDAGQVKLIARIRDTNGCWYVTPEVTNLSFQRSNSSVKLYKPYAVPESYWVRIGQVKSNKVNIATLSGATAAVMYAPTWNGNERNASFYNRVNSWTAPKYGLDHFYSFDRISVPLSALMPGENTITYSSSTTHHGIEVMWPGPAIAVRYGSAPTATAPSILQQPANQTVTLGQTATFSVSATGTGTLSYQWRKNGTNISGATSSSYTTPATTSSDNGATFSVVVSNAYGSVTSSNATLTVQSTPTNTAPTITQQPSSQAVQEGQTATFSVSATGTGTLSYQWRKNGTNISGATSSSYTTPATTSSDNGATFSVVVSNDFGSVTSSNATLTVSSSTSTPSNVITNPGFESGTTGWTYYTSGQGTFTVGTPAHEGSRAAQIAVNSAASNNQLFQSGITLEPNTTYTLSFAALSNTGRALKVSVQKHGSPFTSYGLSGQTVNLGTNWSVHTVSFTTRNFTSTVNDARLMFWFADTALAGDKFSIDNVVLSKGTATPQPEPPAPSDPIASNAITNPGFESGTTGWTYYTSGQGTFTVGTPAHEGSRAAQIAVNSAASNNQLFQSGITLEPNTTYTLSFAALSNTGRALKVSVQKHGSPFTSYGLSGQTVNLGTNWSVHTVSFTTRNFTSTVNDARLMFWFADTALAGDKFSIDNVVLSKGTGTVQPPPSEPVSSNEVLNAGFEDGTRNWTFYTNGSGIFTIASPGRNSAGAGRVALSSVGSNTQLYQQGLSLEPNTTYQLSFWAYSNSGRDFKVSVQKHGSPFTNYGLSGQTISLGTNWSQHTVSFTTRNFSSAVNDARLMFWFADTAASGDQFFIDDVALIKQ